MVELLEKLDAVGKRMVEEREQLGLSTEADELESHIRSVYASLAIEDPTVTVEEVREVLAVKATM